MAKTFARTGKMGSAAFKKALALRRKNRVKAQTRPKGQKTRFILAGLNGVLAKSDDGAICGMIKRYNVAQGPSRDRARSDLMLCMSPDLKVVSEFVKGHPSEVVEIIKFL